MNSVLRLLGSAHEKALRDHLTQWKESSVFPLGILSDHGLGMAEDATLKAYGLWAESSEKATDSPLLKASVLVGGSGGLILPFATSPLDAEILGDALKDAVTPRSVLGPKRICDGFLRGIGFAVPREIIPFDLYGASPDFLGPFVCPELRRATVSDMPQLVSLAAQGVLETTKQNPLATSKDAFERRILARVHAGRTFVLGHHGSLALKLEIAVAGSAGAQIEGLYVREDMRRRGLATLSLGQLTRHLLGRMPCITLKIPSNDERAAKLCKRVGYLSVRKSDEMRLMLLG